MIGIDGHNDILVIEDAFSGCMSAYPMPDKTADSTVDVIKHVKGERTLERFYSDRSGGIDRALRDLHIVRRTVNLVPRKTLRLRSALHRKSWEEPGRRWSGQDCHHVSGRMLADMTG